MRKLLTFLTLLFIVSIHSQEKAKDTTKSNSFSELKFRSIGPAFTSGRIADFAVNPDNSSEYYVGVAAGNIWKTVNNGTTFEPVFDNYGSFSIGCLKMDPKNHNIVWAGTGENNHQRSVSYGDGIYKTLDGGKSWKNMGLKESRQIGAIAIDPRNSNIVFVAAEGSVWGPGGERGLYKTSDGGTTWEKVLNISENTGINNVVIDPINPDVMYATSEQRRRHVQIRIGGGPESALWKSTDAGKTWRKLTSGLPEVDKGGMHVLVSPVDHNLVYLMVEAAMEKGGFYRSTDQGESWERMSDYNTSGQYYGEFYAHPTDINTLYSMETVSKVTYDAGKTWTALGLEERHVDDHAFWIDPTDTQHFMIGGDGGIYESFDHGKHFIFKSNLPVTQFYRVSVDNEYPFYNVYGGTQDNNSFGGPSQSLFSDGVMNHDWITTLGGDGFWQAIDPENPDIVYSEYQYGNLFRFDRKSGERIAIKPLPRAGEDTYKWHWDTPFILSTHNSKRLYMVANKVFRSDDRGDSWQVISEDISQNLSRDKWPVMDRYWSVDGVAKNVSTSQFGLGVSLCESPVKENLIYVGTDDGVVQVSENAGISWSKISKFEGVPEYTYVSDVLASKFDENIVFATFNNHKRDDFSPYVLMSKDKGKTWKSISSNLPKNGPVHTIEQDFVNPQLLFVGTEFGLYFSTNSGESWTQMKSGLPTTAVRDLAIQKRENDLIVATFGRGFYILDNYTPMREWNTEVKSKKAHIFSIENALLYVPKNRGGSWGSMPYVAKNPEYGATFTYYIKEEYKTAQAKRRETEKELIKTKSPIPEPSPKVLFDEKNETPPYLIFTISDIEGNEVRKIFTNAKKGINRINWNLKYLWSAPIKATDKFDPSKQKNNQGIFVLPGTYQVKLDLVYNNQVENLVANQKFEVIKLQNTTLPAENPQELAAFQLKLKELARITMGTRSLLSELQLKINEYEQAALSTTGVPSSLITDINLIKQELKEIEWKLDGEQPAASYEETKPDVMAIMERLEAILYIHTASTSGISQKQMDGYEIVKNQIKPLIVQLNDINLVKMAQIEALLNQYKAPWTSGRVLEFKD
jgi:photosystem II stability/assembly factor-like uncharacterized protein